MDIIDIIDRCAEQELEYTRQQSENCDEQSKRNLTYEDTGINRLHTRLLQEIRNLPEPTLGISAEGVGVLRQYLAAHRAMTKAEKNHALLCAATDSERRTIKCDYLTAENIIEDFESLLDELSD